MRLGYPPKQARITKILQIDISWYPQIELNFYAKTNLRSTKLKIKMSTCFPLSSGGLVGAM